jgi:hypothetical protein
LFLRIWGKFRLRTFENRMLRRISGPERDELRGSWTKLRNAGIRTFDSPPNIMTMIELSGLIRAGHLARIRKNKNAYHGCDESQKDGDH